MMSSLMVAGLAAAAPLLAMGTERWPGLAPCALCLWQRWPYWVAAAIALAAAFVPGHWRPWLLRAAGVAVLVSGAVAVLHVGVEQGWWPSPLPACQAPAVAPGASVDDLLRSLNPAPSKPCDEPAYLIPGLPLSMAMMNLIYAAGLAAFVLGRARRRV
jgi:disulfide bond formation protein DsbB